MHRSFRPEHRSARSRNDDDFAVLFDASFEALFDVLFGFAPFGRPLIASCRTDAGEPAVTGHTASRGRAVEDGLMMLIASTVRG
ncbi:hypothetical protein [Bradyrhizobium australafricanum]|uniref:hypothetical protein n=1 Tax=Bradyrhizobium australafricanum TaxID=2821406 RepID=UPI001CE263A7|nr:hypothetical protein [Bradyrhizobium australafricanum]MCA6096923.1 hypothetical protein [Bradyrhizobium australafricanum]